MTESARSHNHADEVEGFLDTLFDGQEGYVYTPTKNPSTGAWVRHFFKYPEEKNSAVMHMMDASTSKEVYLSPALYSSATVAPVKKSWKGTNYVWAEFDGNAPDKTPDGIPTPSIRVQSSTPGHEHWYWRLNGFETDANTVEGLSKKLAYTLDADRSGWDSKQVLRPPGTLHHDSKRRVRLLSSENRTVSFADFVGLVEVPQDDVINIKLKNVPDVTEVVQKYKFNTDARDLFSKKKMQVGHRSEALMRMGYHCVEMGMSDEETYSILFNCDERWGKFKTRTPESRAKALTGIIIRARSKVGERAEKRLTDYEPMYTVTELLALDYSEVSWVFEQVVSKEALSILAGDPGVGKSTVAMQMGMAIVTGRDFLEWKNSVDPMRVGMFSYEMGTIEVGHFLRTMLPGYSAEEQLLIGEMFHVRPQGHAIRLDQKDYQDKVKDYVDQKELEFLIFDSINAIGGLQEKKSYENIQAFIDEELRIKRHCTVLMIHHNRKPSQEGPTGAQSLADLYGDVFIQAGASHVLGLRAKKNGKELEVANTKNRLATPMSPFRIKRTDHLNFQRVNGENDSSTSNESQETTNEPEQTSRKRNILGI